MATPATAARYVATFSRIVRCVYSAQSPQLACAPDLLLSAAEMSDIVISDLPAGKAVKISAMVARDRMPR